MFYPGPVGHSDMKTKFIHFYIVDNLMSTKQFNKTSNVEIKSHAKLRLQSAESKQAKGHGGHSRGSAVDFGLIRIGVTFQTPSNQNHSSCIMFNMEQLTLQLGV